MFLPADYFVQPDDPVRFGYKCSWFAVRTDDPQAVASALGLGATTTSNWQHGVECAYKGGVFLTPPIHGWVLVVSTKLPHLSDERNGRTCLARIALLSRRFGEAQYFGTHRVVGLQEWAWAKNGHALRAYAWIGERGEVHLNLGERTPEEVELGIGVHDPFADLDSEGDPLSIPGEEDVMRLAGKWSINPNALDQLTLPKSTGVLASHARGRFGHGSRG